MWSDEEISPSVAVEFLDGTLLEGMSSLLPCLHQKTDQRSKRATRSSDVSKGKSDDARGSTLTVRFLLRRTKSEDVSTALSDRDMRGSHLAAEEVIFRSPCPCDKASPSD